MEKADHTHLKLPVSTLRSMGQNNILLTLTCVKEFGFKVGLSLLDMSKLEFLHIGSPNSVLEPAFGMCVAYT